MQATPISRNRYLVFPVLLAAAGFLSLVRPNVPDGQRWDQVIAGVVGMVCALSGIRERRSMRWPLVTGGLAAAVVTWIGLMAPAGAGDANEFTVGGASLFCSFVMVLGGLVSAAYTIRVRHARRN